MFLRNLMFFFNEFWIWIRNCVDLILLDVAFFFFSFLKFLLIDFLSRSRRKSTIFFSIFSMLKIVFLSFYDWLCLFFFATIFCEYIHATFKSNNLFWLNFAKKSIIDIPKFRYKQSIEIQLDLNVVWFCVILCLR